jgi:hypothetical protein
MAELPVLSNCARAVAVEQVNDKQAREIVRDFYHGSASLPLVSSAAARRRVRLGRADTACELEAAWRQVHRHAPSPMRIGRSGSREIEHTIAELSALIKPDDKK